VGRLTPLKVFYDHNPSEISFYNNLVVSSFVLEVEEIQMLIFFSSS
jgi:hypothetical protein